MIRSDAEFYLGEYRRCCAAYTRVPIEQRRQRDFYGRLSEAMLNAYVEAVSIERSKRAEI